MKTKIEVVILVLLVITAIILGIPAYESYISVEKAIAIYNEGDNCLHRNDNAGAKAKFKEAIQICPYLRASYEELAAISYFEGDIEEACKIYEQAIVAMPDDPEIYLSYAKMLFSYEQYEKARDMSKKALDIDSNGIYAQHYDLFSRMCTDPELAKSHKKFIEKNGRGKEVVGAHHHYKYDANDENKSVNDDNISNDPTEDIAEEQSAPTSQPAK